MVLKNLGCAAVKDDRTGVFSLPNVIWKLLLIFNDKAFPEEE